MIKKKFLSRESLLTLKQGILLRQGRELHQKEASLRHQLQDLPAALEVPQPREAYRRALRRATFISEKQLPRVLSGTSCHRPTHSLPTEASKAAKIRFAILVLTLTSIVILIWRSIPS